MLRRWLTHLRLCFCSQAREELRGHHLRSALNHSLAHARDGAAHLDVARVFDVSEVSFLFEIQVAGAFQKPGCTFAVDNDAKMLGLA